MLIRAKGCIRVGIVVFSLMVLSGCAGPIRVQGGMLRTPEAKIVAEDGSFTILSGEEFTTPSFVEGFSVINYWDVQGKDLKNLYKSALSNGGKKVRVTVPSRSKPLYGVLAFIPMPPRASGPGTRSFEISIPEKYINAATGGRISVVYELVSDRYINWILWLSDQQFKASE